MQDGDNSDEANRTVKEVYKPTVKEVYKPTVKEGDKPNVKEVYKPTVSASDLVSRPDPDYVIRIQVQYL